MEFLKQLLALVAVYLFGVLTGQYPDFPLDQSTFVNLILWIAGIIGIKSAYSYYQYRKWML